MFREASEAADAVEAQLGRLPDVLERLAADHAARRRSSFVTLARGSSDHAATYAKYVIETRLGMLTCSAAPSVASLYETRSHLGESVLLAISQSGRSPDLLAAVRAAREAGACTVALVNDETSPLAEISHYAIPLCAGAETGVAATKSFIASLTAIAQLAGYWSEDGPLLGAIARLPEKLRQAWALDWSGAVPRLRDRESLYVVARGLGLGVAQEAALKLKETCGQHAEAFSSAELRHGPVAIVRRGFPVLALAQGDGTIEDMRRLLAELVMHGADVLSSGIDRAAGLSLPWIPAEPELQPVLHVQAFYRMASELAIARGCDPDRPRHLRKVTETL
ncbi:MAG TPA: SIS domain-containing protein [Woeseiaceae bacterium]|nr:SIS domain-containing protein [Woeseiaceae bacterium]